MSFPRVHNLWNLCRPALIFLSAFGWLLTSPGLAAAPTDKGGPYHERPNVRTFFISGVESDADVKAITATLSKLDTVVTVNGLTPTSGFANIYYYHHAVKHQQIAQAIADAGNFHASFRFVVPGYAANTEKVHAIFASVKQKVKIERTNKEKEEFVLSFLPLKPATPGPHGVGFNFGKIFHPLADPPPAGLGLKVEPVFININATKPSAK